VYLHIWNGFTKFLIEQSLPWQQASTVNINAYLTAVLPLRKNHTASSTVTQHRYWRILRDIYNHAIIYEWIESNPVLDALHPENEIMPSLSMPQWSTDTLTEYLDDECTQYPETWQIQRDRAMLALMLSAAPKTGEVIDLRTDDVQSDKASKNITVRLTGPRKEQERIVELGQLGSQQMELWLLARQDVEGYPDTLFFGQKRLPNTKFRRQLTHKSVYILVTNFLGRALPEGSFKYGLMHQGAELIRNSVISTWLTDPLKTYGGLEEIMIRAGVKDRRTIERLVR
jgi:site-specific recombinase XerD